jgi:hypothetical protein
LPSADFESAASASSAIPAINQTSPKYFDRRPVRLRFSLLSIA